MNRKIEFKCAAKAGAKWSSWGRRRRPKNSLEVKIFIAAYKM